MISCIIIRLSSFGDYSNIIYNNENLLKLLNKFDGTDFLPRIVQEMLPDASISTRIQLSSPSGANIITILSTRIDIEFASNRKEGFTKVELKELKDKSVQYLNWVYKAFSDVIQDANRMAWFVTNMLFEIDDTEKIRYREKYLKNVEFYSNDMTDEFCVRYSARKAYSDDCFCDDFNVITTINKWNSSIGFTQVDGYKIEFDINTLSENKRNRFNSSNFGLFTDAAVVYQNKLEEDFINEYRTQL